jgi:hypothetical protein
VGEYAHPTSWPLHLCRYRCKLTAMLKWAMRIVAVGGALLAMAVGTAAWMHRTQGRRCWVETPGTWSELTISPQRICLSSQAIYTWGPAGKQVPKRFAAGSEDYDNFETERVFSMLLSVSRGGVWHGFGAARGWGGDSSDTQIICPTWAVIAVLLLPMGLWAGIGWRQRRVKAGYCANCGYDLRASPERCPECGRGRFQGESKSLKVRRDGNG